MCGGLSPMVGISAPPLGNAQPRPPNWSPWLAGPCWSQPYFAHGLCRSFLWGQCGCGVSSLTCPGVIYMWFLGNRPSVASRHSSITGRQPIAMSRQFVGLLCPAVRRPRPSSITPRPSCVVEVGQRPSVILRPSFVVRRPWSIVCPRPPSSACPSIDG